MIKILAVEDETLVRLLVVETLENAGYVMLEAGDGEAALAIVKDTPDLNLIVTDIRMPKLDGFGLAAAVRRLRPELGLLFMTGYSGSSIPAELAEIKTLQKPFNPDDLIAAIEKLLAGSAAT